MNSDSVHSPRPTAEALLAITILKSVAESFLSASMEPGRGSKSSSRRTKPVSLFIVPSLSRKTALFMADMIAAGEAYEKE